MSIKRQLTSLIIATIVLASFFAAIHGFRSSAQQLERVFDQELKTIGQIIASIAANNHNLPTEIEGEVAFQVFYKQVLVSKSSNAATQAFFTLAGGFSERTFLSKRWRTFTLNQQDLIVVVAQPLKSRIESAEAVLYVTITPIILAIPIIAFLVFYIIQKSLRPLVTLSNELKTKSSDDLTIVHINNTPEELKPVITRLNHLLLRVEASFEREKQLTANAAHELRTPISVLTITAHNMAEDYKNKQLQAVAFEELNLNVERMAHVIEQMLALFRFTPEQFRANKQAVNVQSILQDVISNNFDSIEQRQQSISLHSDEVWIQGEQFALYTAFENVLRNAIKYSGETSEIKVTSTIDDGLLLVSIEDAGEGVSATEYDKIFDRFYRAANDHKAQAKSVTGSGLGLSIVKHIVELHEGSVSCKRSALGGLHLQINLPRRTVADVEVNHASS